MKHHQCVFFRICVVFILSFALKESKSFVATLIVQKDIFFKNHIGRNVADKDNKNGGICLEDWLELSDRCVFISQRQGIHATAVEDCRERNDANLFLPKTEIVNQMLQEAPKKQTEVNLEDLQYFWIGLSRSAHPEGTFKWADGSMMLYNDFFNKTLPDRQLGQADCVLFRYSKRYSWEAIGCDSPGYPWICQKIKETGSDSSQVVSHHKPKFPPVKTETAWLTVTTTVTVTVLQTRAQPATYSATITKTAPAPEITHSAPMIPKASEDSSTEDTPQRPSISPSHLAVQLKPSPVVHRQQPPPAYGPVVIFDISIFRTTDTVVEHSGYYMVTKTMATYSTVFHTTSVPYGALILPRPEPAVELDWPHTIMSSYSVQAGITHSYFTTTFSPMLLNGITRQLGKVRDLYTVAG